MNELIWINGEVMPLADARVGVEDRGFQFADGVYEALRIYNGRLFALDRHIRRLWKSAEAIQLAVPLDRDTLAQQMTALVERAGVRDGSLYLQLTRGCAKRNPIFPAGTPSTLLFYTRPLPPLPSAGEVQGITLFSLPDERWHRCWIKSIALLPSILARNAAHAAGADEAVFVHDGIVTEGASSNVFAISGNKLVTHPVGPKVLPGITREVILELAPAIGLSVEERGMSQSEALEADDVFIASSIREILWVKSWGPQSWNGPGNVTVRLHEGFKNMVCLETK